MNYIKNVFCIIIALLAFSACSQKQVALTFDDGPDSSYTEIILDILKKENVKATFFVLGEKCKKYPAIVERIEKEGHLLGSHSRNHKNLTEYKGSDALLDDVHFVDSVITGITGKKTTYFRPPFGALRDDQKILLEKQGYKIIMWTLSTKDWDVFNVKKRDVVASVVNNVQDNDIILLHSKDTSGPQEKYPLRNNTIEALPEVIAFLKDAGYSFVTVNEVVKQEE